MQLDGPEGIAVSPDGKSVYVGAFNSNAVAVFDRVSFTGTITQRSGADGCIVNVATTGCTTGNRARQRQRSGGQPLWRERLRRLVRRNAIGVFARVPATQRTGGCARAEPPDGGALGSLSRYR